ncbi:hypothetical protein PVK06_030409 [Gossypium arboreum]|uniref:Uncharacterized protein n=1 Tax=Gossypium arboreum TaxID=29729 RepID=A0ABR0NN78_GOSAR|nr:hypothetical protein PVK06_030409 [Gossypium arboreum]
MSVFKKESEFEKEASENEEQEQEKARSVSTNRTTSSLSIASSFQVSEELINKFHLHYLPKERRFALVGKGNPSPPMPQGKEGKCYKAFQSPPTYLNVCDYIDDMANCHSLINGDVIILNDGKESITHENYGVDEHVGEVIVSLSTTFNNQGLYDDERFFMSKWPNLRTSCFEDGGNDVCTPAAPSSAYQDSIELPKTPITRAYAKHFLEAVLVSNAKPWFETRANAQKSARSNYPKNRALLAS